MSQWATLNIESVFGVQHVSCCVGVTEINTFNYTQQFLFLKITISVGVCVSVVFGGFVSVVDMSIYMLL